MELTISIDLGSSLTKVVWSESRPHPHYEQEIYNSDRTTQNFLAVEPDYLPCSEKFILSRQEQSLTLQPSVDAWVKLNKTTDDAHAVGLLAQKLSMLQSNKIAALKYEAGLYKILAVVGAIAQRLKLESPTVNLSVLLPKSEWEDRKKLQVQVTKHIRSFWFRGNSYSVTLKDWKPLPEGGGTAYYQMKSRGDQVSLIFGHRNTSYLIFRNSVLIDGDTTNYGFYQFINRIVELSSGQDKTQLTPLIYRLGNDLRLDHPIIQALCKSELEANRKQESKELVRAIAQAQHDYWQLIRGWLKQKISFEVDSIIIAGGAAQYDYLHSRLTEIFKGKSVYWGLDIQEKIKQSNEFQHLCSNESEQVILAHRFVDVYAMHRNHLVFLDKMTQNQSKHTAKTG